MARTRGSNGIVKPARKLAESHIIMIEKRTVSTSAKKLTATKEAANGLGNEADSNRGVGRRFINARLTLSPPLNLYAEAQGSAEREVSELKKNAASLESQIKANKNGNVLATLEPDSVNALNGPVYAPADDRSSGAAASWPNHETPRVIGDDELSSKREEKSAAVSKPRVQDDMVTRDAVTKGTRVNQRSNKFSKACSTSREGLWSPPPLARDNLSALPTIDDCPSLRKSKGKYRKKAITVSVEPESRPVILLAPAPEISTPLYSCVRSKPLPPPRLPLHRVIKPALPADVGSTRRLLPRRFSSAPPPCTGHFPGITGRRAEEFQRADSEDGTLLPAIGFGYETDNEGSDDWVHSIMDGFAAVVSQLWVRRSKSRKAHFPKQAGKCKS